MAKKRADKKLKSFADLLLEFPGWPEGVEPERNRSPGRDVDLGDDEGEAMSPEMGKDTPPRK